MPCPDCGYMLTAFDKECPRCVLLAAKKAHSVRDAQDIVIHLDPPRQRAYGKWVGFCVLLPLLCLAAVWLRTTIINNSVAPLRPVARVSASRIHPVPAPGFGVLSSTNTQAVPLSTIAPTQTNQETQRLTALDMQVQDYNNWLHQAQDANRNALSAMKVEFQEWDLAHQLLGTPEYDKTVQSAKDSGDREVQYSWEVVRCLKQALTLCPQIKSNDLFSKRYQETNVCLIYENIPTDLLNFGADKLRFLERR